MKKMKQNFLKMSKKTIPCWLFAFFAALVTAMLAICPFLIRDHGYIAMSHDFTAQEIAFNMFMNETVKSGNLLWNWAIDLGSNFLETFSFYNVGSVFFWLSLLFPADMIPRVMGWMIILKFAVAGASSAAYFTRHIKSRPIIIMASLLYAFSGYQACSVVFYHFQDAVALFPLMLVALEQLVEDKKRGRLVVACLINVFCNYVFFVGEVIFLILYYVVKYLIPDIKAHKKGFRTYGMPILDCLAEGALGTAITGVLLLPSISGTLANSRVSDHLQGQSWFSMATSDWLMLIKAFFTPAEPMNSISSVKSADWMTNQAYLPMFGMVFVIAYLLTRKDWISRTLKICFVIAFIPILNNAFMFFSSEEYRRWFYMLIIIMVLATAKVAEHMEQYKITKAAGICILVLGFYILMTKFVSWDAEGNHLIYKEHSYLIGLLIAFVGIALTFIISKVKGAHRNQLLCPLAAIFGIATLMLNIHSYQITTDNSTLNFKTYRNSYAENAVNYMTETAGSLKQDILPYRYYFDEGIGYTYYNMAMTHSLPSINSFISTVHPSVTEYYDELGIGRAVWTNSGYKGTKELLSAKYIVSLVEQADYPLIKTIENSNGQLMYFYENENALPIGFTYDTYMTRSEFQTIDPSIRPVVMLKTLIVEDDDADFVSSYIEHYSIDAYGEITEESWETAVIERALGSSRRFEQGDNYFEAEIDSDSDKYAFFSVPYDKSWKAKVNGEDARILNINGLMAVQVSGGVNEIRFDYVYLPLKLGMVCSLCGIILFMGYIFIYSKKKTNN